MKRFLIFLLILCFSLTSAVAAPSPDTTSLYKVSNTSVKFVVPDADKVNIDFTEPYTILSDSTYFSATTVNNFMLSEILVIKLTDEVERVEFNFPTIFTSNQLVINVFSYQEQVIDFAVVTFGQVAEDGGEYVNLCDLPLNTQIIMYVLTGTVEDINKP